MEKVVLGLSGGVDSALSAALLKEAGYEVIGMYMDFGLVSPDDAIKTAESIGIKLYIRQLKDELEKNVCSYFVNEYLKARTPNPCIVCNPTVKFKNLIDLADELGAKYVATGHYAKTVKKGDRQYIVRSNSPKDQSYMLCRLPSNYVDRIIFPLAQYEDKAIVREMAKEHGIEIAQKPDSMEVCFIPSDDHDSYIRSRVDNIKTGNFVDENGKILGKHKGIHCYTIGQRKGLGISSTGKLYVHHIDTESGDVVLSLEDVKRKEILVSNVNFICEDFIGKEFTAEVRVRHSKKLDSATVISYGDDKVKIIFDDEVRAPTPGQSAVFYKDDILVGGGFID